MKSIICIFLFFSILSTEVSAKAPKASVKGSFCSSSSNNLPVPGLKVSLVHPKLGRSRAAITNLAGAFTLRNIPRHAKPYYLEVYWGKKIIYRSKLLINKSKIKLPMKCI